MLILDEPTKGVDIGTRTAIYALLREVAAARYRDPGLVSSDFEELLSLTERIVVISDGTSIAEMPSAVLDEEKSDLVRRPPQLDGTQRRHPASTVEPRTLRQGTVFWALARPSTACSA